MTPESLRGKETLKNTCLGPATRTEGSESSQQYLTHTASQSMVDVSTDTVPAWKKLQKEDGGAVIVAGKDSTQQSGKLPICTGSPGSSGTGAVGSARRVGRTQPKHIPSQVKHTAQPHRADFRH